MPFRIPRDYRELRLYEADPWEPSKLRAYIEWLKKELSLAELALASTPDPPKPPPEKGT